VPKISVVGNTAPFRRASFATLASAGTSQRLAAKLGTSVAVILPVRQCVYVSSR
jgi:hypothetical protein